MQSLCPNKEVCGSCPWSHIPYSAQLRQKLADINHYLTKNKVGASCEQILPSPKIAHYRNRMDFVIHFQGLVGLRMKGKWWRVIDNHTCFIADEPIEKAFATVREWVKSCGLSYYDRKANRGFLRYAVIRASSKGDVLVNIITSSPNDTEKQSIITGFMALAKNLGEHSLVWSVNNTSSDTSKGKVEEVFCGKGYIEEIIDEVSYQISPGAFFQTNSYCAPILLDKVCSIIAEIRPSSLLDLYCGIGFFSIAIAKRLDYSPIIWGIEEAPEMVEIAQRNASANGTDVSFFCSKTEDFSWADLHPKLVIIDPPRSGLHPKALNELIQNAPPYIVYVSCNYKKFAQEASALTNRYELKNIVAIDMFPHTPHVEMVSLFVCKS